ncbi:histone [archaeon CG10_big_fil_rev_8_21_14_0_10_43_11]|nr:MAG: histone [archaeon CG10_big_fil_rev_8_21_14_0_10_43_11]
MILPRAPIERLAKIAGERQGVSRVSAEAVKALAEILEEKGKSVSKEAYKLAKHAKRQTVKEEDILLAKIE